MTFRNNEREYYQYVGGECTRTNKQSDAKQFWSETLGQKEHNKETEWIYNLKKNYKDSKKTLKEVLNLD